MTINTTLFQLSGIGLDAKSIDKIIRHLGPLFACGQEFPLVTVLDVCGLDDALYCLQVCPDVAAEFDGWCDTADYDSAATERLAQTEKLRELLS